MEKGTVFRGASAMVILNQNNYSFYDVARLKENTYIATGKVVDPQCFLSNIHKDSETINRSIIV